MGNFDFMSVTNYADFHPKDEEVPEYCRALRTAFVDGSADYVVLDSNPSGNKFLYKTTRWAVEQGILSQDVAADEGQSIVWTFRLTSNGLGKLLGDAIGNPLPIKRQPN